MPRYTTKMKAKAAALRACAPRGRRTRARAGQPSRRLARLQISPKGSATSSSIASPSPSTCSEYERLRKRTGSVRFVSKRSGKTPGVMMQSEPKMRVLRSRPVGRGANSRTSTLEHVISTTAIHVYPIS